MEKRFTLKALAAAALLALGATAQAAYPDKPIKLVVPFSAGGTTDVVARKVAPKVAEILGQPVIIENKGGAGASIGTELVAKSPADGYTLLMATNSHTVNPYVYKNLSFDTANDFVSIALIADTPGIFVVHPSVKANNVKEFVELAKNARPPLTYGTAGAGTWPHLTTLLFTERAKIEMTHVPYKGAGPAMIDLLGGVYQFKAEGIATGLQQVKAGKLKALGMTSLERVPQLPDVPTVAEQGYPGYEAVNWYAYYGPKALPREIVERLNKAITAVLKQPATIAALEKQGVEPQSSTPEELARYTAQELKTWGRVVKEAGIQPQ